MSEFFRRYPDLDMAALVQRQTRILNMWYFLRCLDKMGNGVVDYFYALHSWVKDSGQCDETFRNIIHDGDKRYWSVDLDHGRKAIFLRSVHKIGIVLSVGNGLFGYIMAPIRELFGSISQRRAAAYAATHCKKRPNPISRAVLKKTRGVCTATMLKYEKKGNVQVHQNRSITDSEGIETKEKVTKELRQSDKSITGLVEWQGKQYIVRRRPNTYIGPHKQRGRSPFRSVNRAEHASEEKITKSRMYFDNTRKAAKMMEKSPGPIYLHLCEYVYLNAGIAFTMWERLS